MIQNVLMLLFASNEPRDRVHSFHLYLLVRTGRSRRFRLERLAQCLFKYATAHPFIAIRIQFANNEQDNIILVG